MKQIIISLRPQQWIKNLFIFLPLVFGKMLYAYPYNVNVVFAFILFCAISSTAYLLNDLYDLKSDLMHPIKKHRPIASGRVSAKLALFFIAILGCSAVALSFMLNFKFGIIAITYLAFSVLYTAVLKYYVIIDVFSIAAFFLLRILAGSVIAEVYLSHWIVVMIALLALFLGFNKRRQEIQLLKGDALNCRSVLAKYSVHFIDQMVAITTASLVVAYMLYTIDSRTVHQFGSKDLLFSVPFVYYGIFRYLYIIYKSKDGDPTQVLLSDRPMQLAILFWLIVSIAVIYFSL